MTSERPIPWLAYGYHSVDLLTTLGQQATQAGINHLAHSWGLSNEPDRDVHNALIPNEYVFSYIGDGEELPPAPLLVASLALSRLDPSSRPVPLMTRHDLMGWWTYLTADYSPVDAPFTAAWSRPDLLVNLGYTLLREKFFEIPEDNHEVGACLSMIGVGALGLFMSQPCTLCKLKRSVAGTLRCRTCSRSKRVTNPANVNPNAAEANRVRRLRFSGKLHDMPLSANLRLSYSRTIAALLCTMPKHCRCHLEWLSNVHASLEKSSTIKQLLGSNFSDEDFQTQLLMLRNLIDENEWDYGRWPEKILQAQSWHDAAEAVKHRRRGPGPMVKTLELANRANELLRQCLSKKEVANTLGVSPSNLSHILRRASQSRES